MIKNDELSQDTVIKSLFKELLENKMGIRFKAKGWSMFPFIRDGDFITVKPASFEEARIGDVLAYYNLKFNKITVHRLVKKGTIGRGQVLITKGDANRELTYDLPIYPVDCILGKVVAINRGNKSIRLGGWLCRLRGCLKATILLHYPRIYYLGNKLTFALEEPHLIPFKAFRRIKRAIKERDKIWNGQLRRTL